MLREYRNRVAVITGAAKGLGRALAKGLAERGSHLALVDIDGPILPKLKEELTQPRTRVTHHCADVSSERDLQRVVMEVEKLHGSLHLLINNAAVSASACFTSTDATTFERIMDVNFFGVVRSCRAFLPLLEQHTEGQILNVSSCFAWIGYPRKTAYASSKAAIRAFSESLRFEIASKEVGVTLLYPGPLHTSIVRSGISDSEDLRAREERFLASRGLPLERVVRRSLDQLLTNPSRILIGLDYHMLDILVRVSPRLASRIVAFASARAGF